MTSAMPIYEFYCGACHRVFSFLSRTINTSARPACPKCGQPELSRRVSAFAISKGRKDEPAPTGGPGGMPDMDDPRMEKAMEALMGEAEGMNEEDPRQAARLMRKIFDATGMPMKSGMEEAIRRMESGEDPDKIEQEMGDVFEEDPFGGDSPLGPGGDLSSTRPGRKSLRRVLPPTVDPALYEM
jgi:putative FmdB family regulatory protein